MSKIFTYVFEGKGYYLQNSDEYVYDCEEFDYEVEDSDLLDEVVNLVFNEYFTNTELNDFAKYWGAVKDGLRQFIKDNDNLDELVEYYVDELKEYFREDAYDEYKDGGN